MNKSLSVLRGRTVMQCGRLAIILGLLLAFPAGGSAAIPARTAQLPQDPEAPLAVSPGSAYISIPAAAFVTGSGHNYENHGRYLKFLTGGAIQVQFHAAVSLPHGATVRQVGFCFFDDSPSKNVTASLNRDERDHAAVEMASVTTTTDDGYRILYDNSIVDATVDNVNSVYYLELYIPVSTGDGDNVWSCGAKIYYNLPATNTGILVVPGSTFTPFGSGSTYTLYGSDIQNQGIIHATFLANVDLPHGAVVTKLTVRYNDDDESDSIVTALQRSDQNGNYDTMATLTSVDGEDTERSTTTISNATIDNMWHHYWLNLDLPEKVTGTYVKVSSVKIDYTLPSSSLSHITSLSAAAFTGFFDELDFSNHARWLYHLHDEAGTHNPGTYLAPVHLPDGAIVESVYFGFYDGSTTKNGTAYLVRARYGVNEQLATGSTGVASASGFTFVVPPVSLETIDNTNYMYYAYYVLPTSVLPCYPPTCNEVMALSLKIYYQPPSFMFLPVVRK